MKRVIAATVAAICLNALPLLTQDRQTTPIFKADFSAAKAPRFGFTNPQVRTLGKRYTVNTLTAGGPGGRAAVELAMLGTPGPPDPDCAGEGRCEGYVGWGEPNPMPDVPQGQARYIRIHLKLACPIRYINAFDGTPWGGKFIMMGDGGDRSDTVMDHESRIIWNLEGARGTTAAQFKIQKNIDSAGEIRSPVACGEWHAYQLRVQSSSKLYPGGNDGRMSFYVDNDNEKAPTSQGATFDVSTSRWDDSFKLGAYVLWAAANSHAVWQIAALEIDDEFDPRWYGKLR